MLAKIAANRNLLKNLVVRDLQRRYVGSIGGFFWTVVHPLVLLASYSFVFSVIFQQPLRAEYGSYNVPVVMFCGILPWLLFSDTVLRCCSSITDNAVLITKTVIPAEILPLSITLSNLVQHVVGMSILLAILVAFFQLHLSVLFVLIYVPMLLMFAQGLGWIFAGLQVFLRDTVQALQVLLIFWFWITPVAYTKDRLPESMHLVAQLNPMVTIVSGYRDSLLNRSQPQLSEILMVLALSAGVFVAGALFFRKAKPVFPDVL